MGGDFNRRDVCQALKDTPSIKIVKTPPTRGTAVLDIIATNAVSSIVDSGVTFPLHSDITESDHKTVFVTVRMPRVLNQVI